MVKVGVALQIVLLMPRWGGAATE